MLVKTEKEGKHGLWSHVVTYVSFGDTVIQGEFICFGKYFCSFDLGNL